MQRGKNDERTCDTLTATQREMISNPPSQCLGRDTTNGNDKIQLSENFVELQSKCSHRLCSAAGASPSRKTQPKIASRFVIQKRIAGIVIALCLTTATNSVSFAQEAAKPVTATEPASGLAFREGGRRILIGKEGGIFFVAAQQVVRNEVGLDNANSIKVHSLIEQYCHELDTMRGRGGPLDSQEMQNLRDLTPEEREKRLFERVKTIEATVGKADETFIPQIKAVFTPEQLERLHQIARQVYGSESLIYEQGLVKILELSADQVKQIGEINHEYSMPEQMMMRTGVSFAKYQQALNERDKKVRAILTKEQQDKLTTLEGKPFDLTKLTSRGPRRTFGWFGAGGSIVGLAGNGAVQKELGLSDEVAKKVEAIWSGFFAARRVSGAWQGMGTRLADGRNVQFSEPTPPDWDFGQWNALIAKYLPELKQVLTADQYSRLKQIHFQAIGSAAYFEPEVIAGLGITQEQQAQIEAITEDYNAQRLALLEASRTLPPRPGVDDPAAVGGIIEKVAGQVREHDAKVDAVLTKAQLDQFASMKGKPFDLDQVRTLDLTRPRPMGPGVGPDGQPMAGTGGGRPGGIALSGRRIGAMFVPGNTGGGDGIFSLLMIPGVQSDLGLNQEVIAKVLGIREQFSRSWIQAGGGFRMRLIQRNSGSLVNYPEAAMPPFGILRFPGQTADARQQELAKMTELWSSKTAEFLPQLKAVVTPDQFQRLQQIYWQSLQSAALGEAEVIEALAIAGEQKQQIEAVLNEFRESKSKLFQTVPPADGDTDPREVLVKLETEQNAKVIALLTKDQQEKFATLKGKEFDIKQLKNVERPIRRPPQ